MKQMLKQIGGAIAFYTCIPLPSAWTLELNRIARWSPLIGLLLGFSLGALDLGLTWGHMPALTRSVLVVALWIGLTGGLHLDGVLDTADGLAVMDRDQRLSVMADSRTGAFGVMAGSLVILLKVCALTDLSTPHLPALITAMVWGRIAQVIAIATYPYLKPEGKGAFHTASFQGMGDLWPSGLCLLATGLYPYYWQPSVWPALLWGILSGSAFAVGISYWFYRQFRGMTGDVYGAIVEWTEALILCCLTLV
ncbi:adenosylcobinamide-GDP ribazoletransferase [Acaryochloris sp. IP29b_bin.148]|uniref:adenosylcobinamide-GDP ribazoletransferase n=1 Tax=Acaryochloris sp. IP29b_bin.148 TaxID=2969218 RepID=UPI00262EFCFF|nr:adenosylcobinamide-GDP ribazoletransferase [Acaryochloris sp. IP29b_bin.148]